MQCGISKLLHHVELQLLQYEHEANRKWKQSYQHAKADCRTTGDILEWALPLCRDAGKTFGRPTHGEGDGR